MRPDEAESFYKAYFEVYRLRRLCQRPYKIPMEHPDTVRRRLEAYN